MKRIYMGIGAVAVVAVVTAGAVALTRGDDSPTHTPSSGIDPSRSLHEGKAEAEQLLKAQADLARRTAEYSEQLQKSQWHQLLATIREESPYDVYKPDANGNICVRATEAPAQLVVDAGAENPKVLAERDVPGTAKLNPDGSCEATVSIDDAPFATHYRLGAAIEGQGILQPTSPGMTELKTSTQRPQKVVVLQ